MSAVLGWLNKAGSPCVHRQQADDWIRSFLPGADVSSYEDERFCVQAVGSAILQREEFVIVADISCNLDSILDAYISCSNDYRRFSQDHVVVVIWNRATGEIFAGVDGMGSRPFYFHDSKDGFVFSSQFDGVLSIFTGPAFFNPDCIIETLSRNFDASLTAVKGVYRLIAGHYLHLGSGGPAIPRRAACPVVSLKSKGTSLNWVDRYRKELELAVTKHLLPEATIGISLSGGLDSSAIAGILATQLAKEGRTLHCFGAVLPPDFPEGLPDERVYMEALATQHPNIKLHFIDIPNTGFFESLPDAMLTEPGFPNIFQYHDRAILQAAAEQGVQVIYSGYGGDYWASWSGSTVIYELFCKGEVRKAMQLLKERSHADQVNRGYAFFRHILQHSPLCKGVLQLLKNKRSVFPGATGILKHRARTFAYYKQQRTGRQNYITEIIGNGSIGRVMSCCNALAARKGMRFIFPLLDMQLLSFLSAVPLDLFVLNGHPRGFIRQAIKDLVPQIIVNRTDKQPYSPGYDYRFRRDTGIITRLLYPGGPQGYEQWVNLAPLRAYYRKWIGQSAQQATSAGNIRFMQWMNILYVLYTEPDSATINTNSIEIATG